MAITKDQIFQAADELDQANQNPTLANVRKALGGGSFTTISEAMNEWRSRKAAEAAPLRDPAPQAVTDRLAELGDEVWSIALQLANVRMASEREALESVRVEMEGSRQEAVQLADQLTQELDEMIPRLAAIKTAESTARSEANDLRQSLTAMEQRAATAEARAVELRTELDHAHQEGHQMRGERDELVKVQAKAEADRANHQEQRKQMAQEAARQAERYTKAQADRDTARRDAAQAREDAAALRGRLEALEGLSLKGRK